MGAPENTFASIPPSMAAAASVGKGMLWAEAIERIERAGFKLAAHAKRSKAEWPEDADLLGPAPEPIDSSAFRHHAMYYHEDGFVLALSSFQGGYPKGARERTQDNFIRDMQMLNDLHVYIQVDVGSQSMASRRNSFSSGGFTWQGDGTSVFSGSADVVNGSVGPLGTILAESHRHARPIPLSQWQPDHIHIDQQLYSDTPHSYMSSEAEKIKKRFAPRLERDFAAFLSGLPPALAPLLDPASPLREQWAPRSDRANDANAYFASQLKAGGANWPSAPDSALMRSWSKAIEDGLAFVPNVDQRAIGGSTILHALACSSQYAAPSVIAWLDKQDHALVQSWLATVDATGSTPAGVAARHQLRAWDRLSARQSTMFGRFMDKGWLGLPGELGRVALDELAQRHPTGRGLRQLTLANAMVLERMDSASRASGTEWLDLSAGGGERAPTRGEAFDALMSHLAPSGDETLSLLEALSLRANISQAPSAALSAPRL